MNQFGLCHQPMLAADSATFLSDFPSPGSPSSVFMNGDFTFSMDIDCKRRRVQHHSGAPVPVKLEPLDSSVGLEDMLAETALGSVCPVFVHEFPRHGHNQNGEGGYGLEDNQFFRPNDMQSHDQFYDHHNPPNVLHSALPVPQSPSSSSDNGSILSLHHSVPEASSPSRVFDQEVESMVTSSPNQHSPPSPISEEAKTPLDLIAQVEVALTQIRREMQASAQYIKNMFEKIAMDPQTCDLVATVRESHERFRQELHSNTKLLNKLIDKVVLLPRELDSVDLLKQEVELLLLQLELYSFELSRHPAHVRVKSETASTDRPAVALVIMKEPFPNVIRQHTQVNEEDMVVHILKGATVEFRDLSPIKASMVVECQQSQTDRRLIESDVQSLDVAKKVAKFPVKFEEGTRKNPASLQFSVQVSVSQCGNTHVAASVESALSSPFVIMTNQRQYEDCERMLLMRDSFGDQSEVSWAKFANAVQRQFLRSTRQNPGSPNRSISSFDFAYFKYKFFRDVDIITQDSYDKFWEWYGHALQLVRYQRHVVQLWEEGLIYGFMGRNDIDAVLSGHPPGSFIIRFSERHAGQFAVSYVVSRGDIRHYLIKSNDTAGAKITLPDFLRSVHPWRYLLRFSLTDQGVPQFERVDKDEALESFYSKRRESDASGYEEMVSF